MKTDRMIDEEASTPPDVRLSSRQKISYDKKIFVSKTKQEEKERRGSTKDDRKMEPCRHDKDGVCHQHGGGAKWKWKPDPR